jgi:hypothetical protein
MTVRELIEKLQKMPQDADVYRLNTEEDRWYTDHYEEIWSVEEVNDYEVRLK